MTTARQALANSTHFHNEGMYWFNELIDAKLAGKVEAVEHARRQMARVTDQLITAKRWQNEKSA